MIPWLTQCSWPSVSGYLVGWIARSRAGKPFLGNSRSRRTVSPRLVRGNVTVWFGRTRPCALRQQDDPARCAMGSSLEPILVDARRAGGGPPGRARPTTRDAHPPKDDRVVKQGHALTSSGEVNRTRETQLDRGNSPPAPLEVVRV